MKSRLKALYVSNLHPSPEKPYSGVWLKNQVDYFKSNLNDEIEIDWYYMLRTFNGKIGTIAKYLKFWMGFNKYLFKKYDIVHIHFLLPNIVLGWLYKIVHPKTFLIVTVHGGDINHQYPKLKWFFKFFTKSIDLIIPVGKTLDELCQIHFPEKKRIIIPVGVDDSVFKPNLGIEKAYDFIFVGSFYDIKGIDYLLNSLKLENELRYKILFIGSGELERTILNLSTQHEIFIMNNLSQKKISFLLNSSKWLLLPSRSEGFPTVTIESFYCAVPIIGSSIPQIKEQVENGINGFIFNVGDIEDLKATMSKAYKLGNEEYQKMARCSANSWRNISLSQVCNQLLNIYIENVEKN